MTHCLPSSFHVFLERREALTAPVLGLLLFTVCCSLWFWLRGRNLKNTPIMWVIRHCITQCKGGKFVYDYMAHPTNAKSLSFCSIKREGWEASSSQGPSLLPHQSTGTHLWTWVERSRHQANLFAEGHDRMQSPDFWTNKKPRGLYNRARCLFQSLMG